MLSFEHGLAAGVLLIYLADSLQGLKRQELLLSGGLHGWQCQVASGRWQLGSRVLWLPSPLFPARLLYKGAWNDRSRSADAGLLQQRAGQMRWLAWLTRLLAGLLLVALPLVLVIYGTQWQFLLLLALIYPVIIGQLLLLALQRRTFGLSRASVLRCALDALLCPPMAVNLLRRVSLQQPSAGHVLLLAQQLMPEMAFRQLVDDLLQRVQLQLDLLAEPPPGLTELRDWLTGLPQSRPATD